MVRDQPLVGWRLWRLQDERLHSWAVDHVWDAGRNEARCLRDAPGVLFSAGIPGGPCDRSPGAGCKCGLWALWGLGTCVRKARKDARRWDQAPTVIGLVTGWGTAAIHGDEGFRCQYASVACLFTDTIGDRALAAVGRWPRWWGRLVRRRSAEEQTSDAMNALQAAAGHYGVPLLSLEEAVRLGALGEFGVSRDRIVEVEAELTAD
jgi:hypothetical protein